MKEKIEIGYIREASKAFLPENKVVRDLSILGFEGITFKREEGFLADKNKIRIYVNNHKNPNILKDINFWRNKAMAISGYEAYSINYDVSLGEVKRHSGNHIAEDLKVEAIKKL